MTDSILVNAQRRLALATLRNREAENAEYCCDASRNQAVGKTRKQVKRWETFIADHQSLTQDGAEERDDGA